MDEEIKKFIGEFNRAPFLFIGSGLSRRYLSLEDWEKLLVRFCKLIGREYQYYYSSAEGSLSKVASLLANDLHEVWWKDSSFERSRKKYGEECCDRESALKIEIAHYIKGAITAVTTDPELLEEIRLLRKVVIDGIITTNWDNFLEQIFKDFKTYVGQNELIFSSPQGIGEIYKIHGCCSQPNSLVLTSRDYDNYEGRNPYLAAKLLTIFTEHPVIFLGYSLTDENILKILDSISSCLTSDNIKKLQDRLIFVQWDESAIQPLFRTHTISVDSIRIPVKTITTSSFLALYKALGSIERRFPARLLRQLKEHVYDLVASNEKVSKIYVQNIEDSTQDIKELEVVFGVGAINKVAGAGYKRIGRIELIEDLIYDNRSLDNDKTVKDTLVEILKNTKHTPFFKYIVNSNFYKDGVIEKIDDHRVLDHFGKAATIEFYAPTSPTYTRRKTEINAMNLAPVQFIQKHSLNYFLKVFCYIKEDLLTSEELLEIIKENMDILNSSDASAKSYFYKLICFYDWIRYYKGL